MKLETDDYLRTVESVMATIAQNTSFAAIHTSLNDSTVLRSEPLAGFCSFCLDHPATASLCRYACRQATMQSLASGEPYFQRCWAGLFYTTAALAPDGICRGGISIGGFYTTGEEDDIHAAVSMQVSDLPESEQSEFMRRLDSILPITPASLRGLGVFLMESTISSGINSDDFFRRQSEKYRQQRAIAEVFHDIQKERQAPLDVIGDTYHFVSILREGNREGAMEFISEYLARILAMSNWDLRNLKANARVLLAVMTSRAIMDGVDWEVATSREKQLMNRLMTCDSTEDCCLEIADLVMSRHDRSSSYRDSGSTIPERVAGWMKQHYDRDVTLEAMARAVGASTSTIVHELKKKTGKTSRQLLLEIRIDEARRLLATTSLEIAAIAGLCGFCDQSHFTKAFKSVVNLTPGRFRKLLHFTKEDV